jgi:hypothetical protein
VIADVRFQTETIAMSNPPMFVIEWSHSQKMFHIHTLEESIAQNTESMIDGTPTDYILVGTADTHEQAQLKCSRLKTQAKGYVPILP